jgi:GNAT superfamily N-acetyltransferase
MATVEQLGAPDVDALTSLLARDPIRNLHLLGLLKDFVEGGDCLEVHGCRSGETVTAAVWVDRPRGRVLPTAGGNPDEFRAIAEHLKPGFKLGSIVGDKTAVEPLEAALANGRPRLHYLHRLFWVGPDQLGPYLQPGLRSANPADVPQLLPLAINAFCETLGAEPDSSDLGVLRQQIEQSVLEGRTYVLVLNGKLVFKADLAWKSSHGAEVSGVYTVPDHRHRGLATLALGQLSRQLLASLPRLILRCNEQASRVARRVGYECRPVVQLLVTHGG